jgi:hypothetical protein
MNTCKALGQNFFGGIVQSVTTLHAGRFINLDSIPGRDKRFSLLQNVRPVSGAHPASYTVWYRGVKGPQREVNHSFHLVRRLKTSGAITLLPLYAFMAYKGQLYHLFTIFSATTRPALNRLSINKPIQFRTHFEKVET